MNNYQCLEEKYIFALPLFQSARYSNNNHLCLPICQHEYGDAPLANQSEHDLKLI